MEQNQGAERRRDLLKNLMYLANADVTFTLEGLIKFVCRSRFGQSPRALACSLRSTRKSSTSFHFAQDDTKPDVPSGYKAPLTTAQPR